MSMNGGQPLRSLADQLRDRDALRDALDELSGEEVGEVLAMVLLRWGDVGDTPLVEMMRVLADTVEQGQVPENIIAWDLADGMTPCMVCGKKYLDHPMRRFTNDLILHELCDGALVKL